MSETTLSPVTHQPAILLFGLDCRFTFTVLNDLLHSNIRVTALIVPGPPSLNGLMPVNTGPPNLMNGTDRIGETRAIQLAHRQGVPVYRAGKLDTPETVEAIIQIQADILVCACFNRLIPQILHESFQLGGINCHPSLLPNLRGPDPVFWTFKYGENKGGVTIHRLSSRFDSGNILVQQEFEIRDGMTELEFDSLSGRLAGELLLKTLCALMLNLDLEIPQDEAEASYGPFPTPDDFHLDQSGTARSAFNFVRGIEHRGIPFTVHYRDQLRHIATVNGFTVEDSDEVRPKPAIGNVTIEFASGRLIADLV